MVMESKDKNKSCKKAGRKDLSFKSLCSILTNTLNGLKNFFRYERSALVYLIASAFTLGAGIILQMSMMEWIMIFFVLLTMLASELLNTAIEAICDLVSPEYNPFVKIAKDSGSAATGVLAILWAIMILMIYFPKVIEILKNLF